MTKKNVKFIASKHRKAAERRWAGAGGARQTGLPRLTRSPWRGEHASRKIFAEDKGGYCIATKRIGVK